MHKWIYLFLNSWRYIKQSKQLATNSLFLYLSKQVDHASNTSQSAIHPNQAKNESCKQYSSQSAVDSNQAGGSCKQHLPQSVVPSSHQAGSKSCHTTLTATSCSFTRPNEWAMQATLTTTTDLASGSYKQHTTTTDLAGGSCKKNSSQPLTKQVDHASNAYHNYWPSKWIMQATLITTTDLAGGSCKQHSPQPLT